MQANFGSIVLGGMALQFPEVSADKKSPVNNLPAGYPVNLVRFTAGGYDLSGQPLHVAEQIVQQAPAGAGVNLVRCGLRSADLADWELLVRLQSGGSLVLEPPGGLSLPMAGNRLVLRSDVQKKGVALEWKTGVSGAGRVEKTGGGAVFTSGVLAQTGGLEVIEGVLQRSLTRLRMTRK